MTEPIKELKKTEYDLRELGPVGVYPIHPADQALQKILRLQKQGPWVCGGAALRWYKGEQINAQTDIDVFFNSERQFLEIEKYLRTATSAEGFNTNTVFRTDNARTLSLAVESSKRKWYNKSTFHTYRVQLINKHFFDTVDDVLKQFDLSVCKVGTDGNRFYFGDGALKDIRTRTLNYSGPLRKSAYMRILKYNAYGYRPSRELQEKLNEQFDVATDFSDYSPENAYEVGF